MAVSFSAEPEQVVDDALDHLLHTQLRSTAHADLSPRAILLRCLNATLGATPPRAAHAVRARLRVLAGPEVRPLVTDPHQWARLVSLSRKRVASSSSAGGVAVLRLEVARRVVGRVVTPLPPGTLTWAREVNARAALAIIGCEQIELGYEKIVISAGFVAVRLGVTRPYAQGILRTLERDLHWIVRDGKRRGAIRWRLTKFSGPMKEEYQGQVELHSLAVDALASGELAGSALATVIASADHPAWFHSMVRISANTDRTKKILGARGWISVVHAMAGPSSTRGKPTERDAQGLGLSMRRLRATRREAAAEMPGIFDPGASIAKLLAAKSAATGASLLRDEHEQRQAREAAAWASMQKDFATKRAADAVAAAMVKPQITAYLKRAPLPSTFPQRAGATAADAGEIAAAVKLLTDWTSQAAGFWVVGEGRNLITGAEIPVARKVLEARIVDQGFEPAKASKVAAYLFRDEPVPLTHAR